MSDTTYPDRDTTLAAVRAELVPGGRPLATYLAYGGDNTMPASDSTQLRDEILTNLELRLRHAEHVAGIA